MNYIKLRDDEKEIIRNNPDFNILLEYLEKRINKNGLESIFLINEDKEDFIKKFNSINYSDITLDFYMKVASYKYEVISQSKNIIVTSNPNKENISEPKGGAWESYINKLKNKGYSIHSIDSITNATAKIVKELKTNTAPNFPVRGMVVGNVQSGKTANIAGVISLAADKGYNFFIILSGIIENLRRQTQDRLFNDLRVENRMLNFNVLENLSPSDQVHKIQNLYLNIGDKERYVTVCLKHKKRLENLIKWICKDETQKRKLKVLVIDDEADQASINTGSYDKNKKTTICRLIENLVMGRTYNSKENIPYQCMNYIGYTATPYGNFLNTAEPESLYPKDFIMTLEPAKDYIGPKEIFGFNEDIESETLNIINYVPSEEAKIMTELNEVIDIPKAFLESIIWFSITVILFRKWDLKQPVSMLIHTSIKEGIHKQLKELTIRTINEIKKIPKESKIELIEEVFDKQRNKLNKNSFLDILPNYESKSTINDFPKLELIIDDVLNLLDKELTYIMFDEDNDKLSYSDGIHLCIDNSYNNKIEDHKYKRLVYPEKTDIDIRNMCPAFIIIGGATLSRGLTLEGLTVSYFLRNTNTADSLMQMGRWFGYRKKYEVLPRLWITENDRYKFEFLAKLDEDLRKEIEFMHAANLKPEEYAVKIDAFPAFKSLKVTAKNKMQDAILADYSNHRGQTIKFYGDEKTIDSNLNNTINFFTKLGKDDNEKVSNYKNDYFNLDSKIWLNISYDVVLDYLKSLKFPSQASIITDYDAMRDWFKEQTKNNSIDNWHIILSSPSDGSDFVSGSFKCKLTTRTKINDDKDIINIKAITRQSDHFMDIDCRNISEKDYEFDKFKRKEDYQNVRYKYGLSKVPLLIVYIIDKDSKVTKTKKGNIMRYKLNITNHLVGYDIYIPNDKVNRSSRIMVNLRKYYRGDEYDEN